MATRSAGIAWPERTRLVRRSSHPLPPALLRSPPEQTVLMKSLNGIQTGIDLRHIQQGLADPLVIRRPPMGLGVVQNPSSDPGFSRSGWSQSVRGTAGFASSTMNSSSNSMERGQKFQGLPLSIFQVAKDGPGCPDGHRLPAIRTHPGVVTRNGQSGFRCSGQLKIPAFTGGKETGETLRLSHVSAREPPKVKPVHFRPNLVEDVLSCEFVAANSPEKCRHRRSRHGRQG